MRKIFDSIFLLLLPISFITFVIGIISYTYYSIEHSNSSEKTEVQIETKYFDDTIKGIEILHLNGFQDVSLKAEKVSDIRNDVVMYENIKITLKDSVIYAKNGYLNKVSSELHFSGGIKVVKGGDMFIAKSAIYNIKHNKFSSIKNLKIYFK